MIRKQLSLLLLIIVLLVPAIHKMLGEMPPAWFVGKFENSLIGSVPGGLSISFFLIVLLELVGPLLLLIGLVQMIRKAQYARFVSLGFLLCYVLFLILTFGSFLVQDYDNGFKDFLYFVGVLAMEQLLFSKRKEATS